MCIVFWIYAFANADVELYQPAVVKDAQARLPGAQVSQTYEVRWSQNRSARNRTWPGAIQKF